ncbi:MAG: hypothetical protein WAW86_01040 [Gammaproteobacteria bacterium]
MARTRSQHSPKLNQKKFRVKPESPQQKAAAELYLQKQLTKNKPSKKFTCSSYPLNAFKQMSNSQKIIFSLTILMFGYAFIQISRKAFSDASSSDSLLVCNRHHLFKTNHSISEAPKEISVLLSELSILAKKSYCHAPYATLNSPEICHIQPIDPSLTSGTYVLKEHFPNSLYRTNALEVKFNQEFVQCNLGIQHANNKIFSIDDKFYSGSKFISEFQSLDSYLDPLDRLPNKKAHASIMARYDFGDDTICQLAVAYTFIDELHRNNVGFNENGLVIIDSDSQIQTKNAVTYAQLNAQSAYKFPFYLSGNDFLRMKEMYIKMQSIPLPEDPTNVGISSEVYQTLLTNSINMCDRIYKKLIEAKIDMDTPNKNINFRWSKELANIYAAEKQSLKQQDLQKARKLIN